MDIDLLSKMVGELILDHDEVGLPGLGTFVSELVPASFSDRGYTINPPYRRLSFHAGAGEEDLLVRLYAEGNEVDENAARLIISDFLKEMKEVLVSRKIVVFPGLGRLRATKENNFFFVCDEDLDIFPDGYGLEPVSLKTHSETPEEVSHAVSALASIVTSPAPEPVAAPEPEVVPEPEPPEPVAVPEAEPVPAPEPEPTDVHAAEPEPEPQGDREAAAEPAPEPVPQAAAPVPAEPALPSPPEKIRRKARKSRSGKTWRRILTALLVLVLVAAAAMAAFLILARVAPDFIDSILYTPEELRILNY